MLDNSCLVCAYFEPLINRKGTCKITRKLVNENEFITTAEKCSDFWKMNPNREPDDYIERYRMGIPVGKTPISSVDLGEKVNCIDCGLLKEWCAQHAYCLVSDEQMTSDTWENARLCEHYVRNLKYTIDGTLEYYNEWKRKMRKDLKIRPEFVLSEIVKFINESNSFLKYFPKTSQLLEGIYRSAFLAESELDLISLHNSMRSILLIFIEELYNYYNISDPTVKKNDFKNRIIHAFKEKDKYVERHCDFINSFYDYIQVILHKKSCDLKVLKQNILYIYMLIYDIVFTLK